MNQGSTRLWLYIISMVLTLRFKVWGALWAMCLGLAFQTLSVVLLGILKAWWALSGIYALEGYHTLEGKVVMTLGKGALLDTKKAKLYWPEGSSYLGCQVRVSGIVYPPHLPENPGGFDQRRWLKRYGIASILRSQKVSVQSCYTSIQEALYHRIEDKIRSLNLQYHPEIMSLILGSHPGKDNTWYTFGVVHFLSVSGFHLYRLYDGLCQISQRLLGKRWSKRLAYLGVYGYVSLMNFPISALRALSMLGLQLLGLSSGLRYSVTLAGLLSWDPLSIWDMGLWYGCVASGISILFPKDTGYYMFLALSLVSYGFGMPIEPLGLVANYLLVPYFVYGVFPALIVSCIPGCSQWGLLGVDRLLGLCIQAMEGIKRFSVPLVYRWDRGIAILVLMGLRYWFSIPKIAMLALYLGGGSVDLLEGQFKIDVLSVGHGLSVVISTKHHHAVYDIGSQYRTQISERTLLPFLDQAGITHLDAVIISHPDYDHCSGLNALLASRSVDTLWVSVPLVKQPQSLCQAGIRWEWDGVVFSFVHPNQHEVWKGNNQSCVLKVTGQEGSALLTGDIEKAAEADLVKKQVDLKSTVLVAPHHGSRTSCHKAFLEAVSPKTIIVSEDKRKPIEHWDERWVYPYFSQVI